MAETGVAEGNPRATTALDAHGTTLYTLYRQRIFQEYELINHRMMWMVLSQAFMFALWCGTPFSFKMAGKLVAIGGIAVTVVSFYSIRAARSEVDRHVSKYQRLYREEALDPRLPDVIGEKSSHLRGDIAPEVLMSFVLILWLALLCFKSVLAF